LEKTFILTLSCSDRPGIVHRVTGFLLDHGGNVTEAAQFNDPSTGLFFMRMRFASPGQLEDLRSGLSPLADELRMTWRLVEAERPMPTVILASRHGHCLNDLLFRRASGLLPIDIRAIVSNHPDFEPLAKSFGIAFHHVPVAESTKADAEARLLQLIESEGAELVVLARYMQVLSDDLCRRLQGQAINIHHSFLPSFRGAKPYQQAHEHGVKIIGATAHYVTADLDEGPIIEQDVARVDHSMDPAALTAIGRDVECMVLARAVLWHAQHRVLLDRNKTVVFR
jgi:formyltetrahydrofolate deformylase